MSDGARALTLSQRYSVLARTIRAMLPGVKLQQAKDELTALAAAYEKLSSHVAAKADGAPMSGGTPRVSISPLPPSQYYRVLAGVIRAMLPGLKFQQAKVELSALANAYEKLANHVAAKTDGAPASGGAPGLRISALPPSALAVGETYDSWLCEPCGGLIALAPREPSADPLDLPDALVCLTCPHCLSQRSCTMHGRRVRKYPWEETLSR